jgi:hypothetical protein
MIFFSSKSFNNNPNGWSDSLRLNYFREAAPIPQMEWLATNKPVKPEIKLNLTSSYANSIVFELIDKNSKSVANEFIVYRFEQDEEKKIIESSKKLYKKISAREGGNILVIPQFEEGNAVYAVSIQDNNRQESEMTFVSDATRRPD